MQLLHCNNACNCADTFFMEFFALKDELREQLRDADTTIVRLRLQMEAAEKVTHTSMCLHVCEYT
jgi:hypothetical protein